MKEGEILITINFYKDGAYVKGHDTQEVCAVISYAMWSCIEDCIQENDNVDHYQSANDPEWKSLGLTYIKIDLSVNEHVKIFNKFKTNIWEWASHLYPQVKFSLNENGLINWETALLDAKKEQGITA